MQANESLSKRLFLIFIGLHLLTWTFIPSFVRYNLPMDALEGTIWGKYLSFGYDKNPFLNGWLSALATKLSWEADWSLYLFSQLCVITCLWAVWKLGKKIITPAQTCLAIFLLETLQYFNLHSLDFNDNTLELGLWALTCYYFYRAMRENTYVTWIATGVFAGLSMMAKYYTLALLAALTLFLLIDKERRRYFFEIKPYTGLLIFLIIITPHFLWLIQHDFITINYVFDRAGHQKLLYHHFLFPGVFLWQQFQVLFPALLLIALFALSGWTTLNKSALDKFDLQYLLTIVLGPLVLTALLSFCFSIKLRAGWGMPILSFSTVLLVALLQPQITKKQLHYYFYCTLGILFMTAMGYVYSQHFIPSYSSANFPGKEIAAALTTAWQTKYHRPLAYVAGKRWLSSNISHYSEDQPAPLFDWQLSSSPWINLSELKRQGAIFVWNKDKERLPNFILKNFPDLQTEQIYTFKRLGKTNATIHIAAAMLPPQEIRN